MTTVGFRELDIAALARVRGGYTSEVLLNPQPEPPGILFSLGVSL